MRGLLAVLYLLCVGWAISHYELDRLALEAAHKGLRGLMREHAEISLEVACTWAPPLPAPGVLSCGHTPEQHRLGEV